MEIERKWMIKGWPEANLPLVSEQFMRQGYLTVRPTVRIRQETLLEDGESGDASPTEYILCFKTGGGLVRSELEFPIAREHFLALEQMIGKPLIRKIRRTYLLELPGGPSSPEGPAENGSHADGRHLEVNLVDEGLPTSFMYAEIEFPDEQSARSFRPEETGLSEYLSDEVTEKPGYSLGEYWARTRENS